MKGEGDILGYLRGSFAMGGPLGNGDVAVPLGFCYQALRRGRPLMSRDEAFRALKEAMTGDIDP